MKTEQSFQFEVVEKDDKKGPRLLSEVYWRHYFKKLAPGTKGSLIVSLKKPTRSSNQLRYYWVLVALIAEYTGYTDQETHDALCRLKWGEREVQIGKDKVTVRKSISDAARLPKQEMAELIEYALEKCAELEIHVPTAEELGYISNY